MLEIVTKLTYKSKNTELHYQSEHQIAEANRDKTVKSLRNFDGLEK